jgi:uncharacterized SAM-binding protein YcdF (DUF218 family)
VSAPCAGSERLVPDSEELVPEVVGAPHRPHRWRRVVGWLVLAAVLAPVVWYGVALFQVWRTARTDRARPAQAIIVLGAAQYDGRPSPVLESRLRHALALWQDGIAPAIVVTGGRQPGDRFTEATASAQWLLDRGVPDDAILREVQGASTWESLAASARFLRARGIDDVVIVSDPYHLLRAEETAEELGLRATDTPAASFSMRRFSDQPVTSESGTGDVVARSPSSSAVSSARSRWYGSDTITTSSMPRARRKRAEETAEELGLRATTSPVPDSLVTGWSEKRRMLKEAAGVSVARLPFVGYRRLLQLTG